MRSEARRGIQVLAATAVAAFLVMNPAAAQAPLPPLPPELAAAMTHCLCLKAATDRLGAEMGTKQRALDDVRAELARVSAQLEAERARVDVNNPEAVSRFRQMLQQRDDLFRRSTGDVINDTRSSVERYNALISQYNASCANRPMDPVLMSRLQATMSCPPLY
jgi:hypothetical protein